MSARLFPEEAILEPEAEQIEGATDHKLERVDVEGLLQVVYGAELHRLDRRRHRAVRGKHDHRHLAVDRTKLAQKLDPALAGHLQVRDDDVAPLGVKRGERLVGSGHRRAVETDLVGEDLQDAAHASVVVDDEDSLHAEAPGTGSSTRKTAPEPSVLSTEMRPRCSWTTRRTNVSPSPAPPFRRV